VLKLVRPLVAEGVTVLPADWVVRGQITRVSRAGKNCKPGRIDWKLRRVTTTDGKIVKIQTIESYVAKPNGIVLDQVPPDTTGKKIGRTADMIARVIAGAPLMLIGVPLIAIAMPAEHGCNGTGTEHSVPQGTNFYAAVSKNVGISAE